MALREACSVHKYMLKMMLEHNAIQVRDIEEIEKFQRRNKEERAKQRMPQFELELHGLMKGSKKKELTDVLFQLGLLKMTKESIEESNKETIMEVKEMKEKANLLDPECEMYNKMMSDMQVQIKDLEQ